MSFSFVIVFGVFIIIVLIFIMHLTFSLLLKPQPPTLHSTLVELQTNFLLKKMKAVHLDDCSERCSGLIDIPKKLERECDVVRLK